VFSWRRVLSCSLLWLASPAVGRRISCAATRQRSWSCRDRGTRAARRRSRNESQTTPPPQAQELTWLGTPPAVAITGKIEKNRGWQGRGRRRVQGRHSWPGAWLSHRMRVKLLTWRLHAKCLSVVVNPEAGLALALELLDETAQVVKIVAAGPGETVGLPNMAVLPGGTYYLRVKAAPAPARRGAVRSMRARRRAVRTRWRCCCLTSKSPTSASRTIGWNPPASCPGRVEAPLRPGCLAGVTMKTGTGCHSISWGLAGF
jgi:hypothetical protein